MLSVLFVDDDAAFGGDGLAWSSAYRDLQDALSESAAVNADGDAGNDVEEIWIAEGAYLPSAELESGDPRSVSFSLVDGVTLYGGFAGTEATVEERGVSAHVTTLSGDVGTVDDPADNVYTVVRCGEDVTAGMDGVAVTGGNADEESSSDHRERTYGGGIYNAGTLTIVNSSLVRNSAYGAGAVFNLGTLTVIGSTLTENSAHTGYLTASGGGIYNAAGTLVVKNSTVLRNSAKYDGGGICNHGGEVTIAQSTFSQNSATDGGGVYNFNGSLTMTDSALSENSAGRRGGGICNEGATLTVINGTLLDNSAAVSGGGIFNWGTLTLTNGVLRGNIATGDDTWISVDGEGGGIYNYAGTMNITNATVVGNWARGCDGRGGGIFHDYGTLTLNNSIVARNESSTAVDVHHRAGTLAGSHNLIGDGAGQTALVDGTDGNLVGRVDAPIDPLLLADGSLQADSPAVDAGENSLVQPGITIDPAGAERIQDGDNDGTATVDIGALEGAVPGPYRSVSDSSLVEGDSGSADMVFTVTLTDVADHDVTFDYATRDGTAETGTDYTATDGSATIPAGETVATIAVPIHGDVEGESDESFYLNAAGETGVLRSPGVGVIVNADKIVVTTSADVVDSADGLLSLREALAEPCSIITFDPALYAEGPAIIALDGSELSIDEKVSIEGPGPGLLTVDAGGTSRVFSVSRYVTAEISGLTVSGGSADRDGGGIYNSGALTMTDIALSGNFAGGSGGGILNDCGTLVMTNGTLSGNSTRGGGGGIFNHAGTLRLTNSTLVGNSAGNRGGGIFNRAGTLRLTNSTLSGNSADLTGGGIYTDRSPAVLNNSVVAKNTSVSSGVDIYEPSIYDSEITGSHNFIGDGSDQTGLVNDNDGNLVGLHRINPIDPLFIRDPSDGGDGWGDDPGTPDIDESANDDYGDLRLRVDSPAVDAGDSGLLPADVYDLDDDGDTAEPIPVDLAGNARVSGASVDMGAYECFATSGMPGDLNNDSAVNSSDLDIIRANWGRAVSPGSLIDGDPSGDGRVSADDLDIVRANWGRTAPVIAGAGVAEDDDDEIGRPVAVYGPQEAADAALGNWDRARLAWADAVEALARGREQEGDVKTVRRAAVVDLAVIGWEGVEG